jgi:hypothetical protein
MIDEGGTKIWYFDPIEYARAFSLYGLDKFRGLWADDVVYFEQINQLGYS